MQEQNPRPRRNSMTLSIRISDADRRQLYPDTVPEQPEPEKDEPTGYAENLKEKGIDLTAE